MAVEKKITLHWKTHKLSKARKIARVLYKLYKKQEDKVTKLEDELNGR